MLVVDWVVGQFQQHLRLNGLPLIVLIRKREAQSYDLRVFIADSIRRPAYNVDKLLAGWAGPRHVGVPQKSDRNSKVRSLLEVAVELAGIGMSLLLSYHSKLFKF
jgi:hypothetical protein